MSSPIEVSVVIVTYNSEWIELRRTIGSFIKQKGISIQIIIADDGSKDNHKSSIIDFFENNCFENYELVFNEHNHGTVSNIISGLKKAVGQYVKIISPGDYAYDDSVLSNIYRFACEKGYEFVFGDAVYYSNNSGKIEILTDVSSPMRKDIYKRYSVKKAFKRLSVYGDNISGAISFIQRDLAIEILQEICPYVKYCEDLSFALIPLKQKKMGYYPSSIIWYQYGTGISTNKKMTINKYLLEDMISFWKFVYDNYKRNLFVWRVYYFTKLRVKNNSLGNRVAKLLVCPERVFYWYSLRNYYYKPQFEIKKLDIVFNEEDIKVAK